MKGKYVSKRESAGQGLVEFALILPVLVLLIMGIIDFGRIIAIYNESSNATREGLRWGIVHPTDCAGITAAAQQAFTLLNEDDVAIVVKLDDGQDGPSHVVATCPIANPTSLDIQPGWRVRVSLDTDVSPLTPIVNNMIPTVPLAYSGARTIFNESGAYQEPPPSGKISGKVTAWGCHMVVTTMQTTELRPIDVINVIDMSGSMMYGWAGNGDQSNPRKIQSAKDALVLFNSMLDPAFGDQVGLVSFPGQTNSTSSYAQTCGGTSNQLYRGKVRSALSANIGNVNNIINSLSASGYTPMADGVRKGREALFGAGRNPDHVPVMIIASDGMANVRPGDSNSDVINGRLTGFGGYDPVSPACNAEAHDGAMYQGLLAKEAGAIVFAIAIGDDFNASALQAIASPGYFIQVVSQDQLEAAYAAIRQVAGYLVVGEVPVMESADGTRSLVTMDDGMGHVFTTVADDSGNYAFYNIPYGQYTFEASVTISNTLYNVLTSDLYGSPTTVVVDLQGDEAVENLYVTMAVPECVDVTPMPTATPGPTPTPFVMPTAVPPTPTPAPLYVSINYPASDGTIIKQLNQTGFEVIAYDPNIGTANGTGIEDVEVQIYKQDGTLILSHVETDAAWCVFAGGSPCSSWRTWTNNNPYSGYSNVSFANAPNNKTYTIKARARASSSSPWTNWVQRTFKLQK